MVMERNRGETGLREDKRELDYVMRRKIYDFDGAGAPIFISSGC